MHPEPDWPRVRELFQRALDLEGEERRAFLAGPQVTPLGLRERLEELLASAALEDDFLESPFAVASEPGLEGQRIGGFRVIRAIASGGMGRVWEAEQDEPRRKVALKTLRAELATPRGRRRFRFEVELLASLRHPAIAQVYGAGVHEASGSSLSWFALEFIEDARSLTRFAEERALDLAERLRLFLEVCRAIQHAHQRGVMHRDLKAGNLLVDRNGHVKVIDFGIARLTEGKARDDEPQTLAGEIVGTLQAMSPEQISGRRDEVDTRTDIWALGAVLYELVTGCRPFELSGLPLPEAARRVCETEPDPPSRVLAGLPRELDWIVGTAMAKEPARRYATANELAQDIERLLAHEPVLAGPPSRTYRLRKFCERHRLGVATLAVAFLALVVGIGGAIYGLLGQVRASRADRMATTEAATTDRFVRFLTDLYAEADPNRSNGGGLSAVDVLERGTAWIRDEADSRPLVQVRLLRAAGQVFSERGSFPEARAALDDARQLARGAGQEGEPELAETLVALGTLHRRLDQGQEAEACLVEALELQERRLGAEDPRLARALNELGLLLRWTDPQRSERYLTRSHELLVAERGPEDPDAAAILANLGMLQLGQGRYEDARQVLEQALAPLTRARGELDPRTAGILGGLASVHINLGDCERAESLQLRQIEVLGQVLPEGHPDIGKAYLMLARIRERLGAPGLAFEHWEHAYELLARHHLDTHPLLIAIRQDQARALIHTGDLVRARALAEAILDLDPPSEEGRLARLGMLLVQARVERLEGWPYEGLARADEALDDPLSVRDGLLLASAHWERAFGWLALGDRSAADAERTEALRWLPPGSHADPYSDSIFAVLAGEPERAVAQLALEVASGYRNPLLLGAPELEALRRRPDFEPVGELLRPGRIIEPASR